VPSALCWAYLDTAPEKESCSAPGFYEFCPMLRDRNCAQLRPRGMARMRLTPEQMDACSRIALGIFADMSNAGYAFQDALVAI
jgi:hypothetical protein